MNKVVENALETVKDKAPEMVKNNKGALIGALIGYMFLSNDPKAKDGLLGAIAGSLFVDKKEDK